ncbi:MAG TPA: hypothetical protein VFM16_07070 [Holophagaceae bacterium]|nr:hypothetical protein [Holophagaceae bacterium]
MTSPRVTSPGTLRRILPALLAAGSLGAWTPRLHEAETVRAVRMVPRRLALLLRAHPQVLLEAAKGQANDQPATAEDVASEFRTIQRMSKEGVGAEDLVRELGILAHLVQSLEDPSCTTGVTPLRDTFEAYADEKLPKLVVTREDYWALEGPLDPTPRIQAWAATKAARTQVLQACVDASGKRLGPWDDLSLPFAQLQLSFSNAVHATANLWILLYRGWGATWPLPADPGEGQSQVP